jgi:1-phosphofructokinase
MNHVDNLALLAVGDENGAEFCRELDKDSMNYETIELKGRIRENITLHPAGAKETRISLDNFSINSDILNELYAKLEKDLDENTLVSFSGRIPKGITKDDAIAFLNDLKATGAKLAVDSNSLTPEDLIRIRPWFIKPNEEEIAAFVGKELDEPEVAVEVAAELVARGLSEEVMISMGARGSVWSDGKKKAIVNAPDKGKPLSTIGAGDSTVAGYMAATAEGKDTEEALKTAASFGSAACYTEGTRPPMPDCVSELYKIAEVSFR